MKQFLFVFLVLGWAAAASADTTVDVIVFDMKASNAGFGYTEDTNKWAQIKDTNTAFVIVEPNDNDSTAKVWAVYTWKGQNKKNYVMEIKKGRALMGGDNNIGLLVDVNNYIGGHQLEVSGKNKQIIIGKNTNASCLSCHTAGTFDNLEADCPSSLTGYEIKNVADASGDRKLTTDTLSLKIDVAQTLAAHINENNTAEDEADALTTDLNDTGYIIVEDTYTSAPH